MQTARNSGCHARVNVMLIDDSSTMRQIVRRVLEADHRLTVIAEADHPVEALEILQHCRPDVLLLDVEMPEMNGLAFLKQLQPDRLVPTVIFSSIARRNQNVVVEALENGAVEVIEKPTTEVPDTLANLPDRLIAAASAGPKGISPLVTSNPPDKSFRWNGKIVLIGASTGGVEALQNLLAAYPDNCPPTLITQHMPEQFLQSLAARLNQTARPNIQLARHGVEIQQGEVAICPGGDDHLELAQTKLARSVLRAGPPTSGHRPSVDVLFRSAVANAESTVAVVLTGMGHDGARGMLSLREAGAHTIAQDKSSSVVFGMPGSAIKIGAAVETLPLSRIGGRILELCSLDARQGFPG